MSIADRDPQCASILTPLPPVRQGDPLAEHRRELAQTAPSLDFLILLRAAGHRAEVFSQLHALELLGSLVGQVTDTRAGGAAW